ncbi:MAG: hypothetical protein Q4E06_01030, partial [Lautropia sp.]|nr:hypothetical protein [Lautropia sp.]
STGGSTGGNVKLPTYPDSNTQAAKVAQDKTDATLSADLFKGSDAANAPQFIKITNVKLPDVSEDNKTKALVFETADGVKNEVVNGESETVLNQTFFHKIVWNAALANGGTIEFVPVADANGTAIPGAKAQTITITEAPPAANQAPSEQTPPDSNAQQGSGTGQNQQTPGGQQNQENPGQKQVPAYDNPSDIKAAVTHDNASHSFEAQKSLLEGTGATKATHVKITEIKKNASDAADADTLKYDGQNVTPDTVIDLSQLSKLVWNASQAEGGSFKFTPVQPDGQPIANGPAAQTMTIEEADAPPQQKVPTYAEGNQHTAQVAHDAQAHTFEAMKAAFEGNHATDKATHVKITEIKKGGGENADAGTLKYKDGNVQEGAVIEVAELNKLVWNASMADGGSFKFTAVQADGEAFANAPATQTVTINEHREAPVYSELNEAQNVRENKIHTFDVSLFNGTKVEAQPQYIKITEIKNGEGANAEAATLLKGSDPVTLNQVIAAADFDKIKWDSSKNENGNFKFISVIDEQGNTHLGAIERTVTITETAYKPEAENKQVDKNAVTALEKALFDHSVEGKAEPTYIKITAIDPRADELAAERIVRTVGQDDNVTKTAYQVIKAGAEGITLEDAKAAAKAMGGQLLEISDQAELDWIKASTDLMGKLNLEAASGDVTKGAWFTNPSDNLATGAADKEVIFSTGTEADNFSFEDAEAATGKASAYVVEFANYNPSSPVCWWKGTARLRKTRWWWVRPVRSSLPTSSRS